jgi:pyridoxamine 5'-phosphate oxidase
LELAVMTELTYQALSEKIWSQLLAALQTQRHTWRLPMLATIDANGLPQARTVVLREVDQDAQVLTIYSDVRSPKVTQLRAKPRASLVFWSEALNWQLRVDVSATVDDDSTARDAVWAQVKDLPAAADYLSINAPGSPLLSVSAGQANEHALCLLHFNVLSMDWLSLNRSGHQRAQLAQGQLIACVP